MITKAAAVAVLGSPTLSLAAPAPAPLNTPPSTYWFADWEEQVAPAPANIFATPHLTNGNIAFTQTQLTGSALAGKPLGVVVETPISNSTASSIFNTLYSSKAVSYVFADMEQGSTSTQIANVTTLVSQVRGSTQASNAYVGQFHLTPLTGVGFSSGQDPAARGNLPYSQANYNSTKVNMANTALYPGGGYFRNKSTFDWANANIRTGLFIAPIATMTAVQNKLNSSYNGTSQNLGLTYHKQIPYVTRFNNWGNGSLDTDQNPANGYAFVPGAALPQAGLSASQTANQMMGRGDFSSQILHYRMRGAYSVHLFEPGAIGYTKLQMQDDARAGWFGTVLNPGDPNGANATTLAAVQHANAIFGKADRKFATMTLNPTIDGTTTPTGLGRAENSGTIWSGVYSVSDKKLDTLVSNLDQIQHMVKFGNVDAYGVFLVKNASGYTWDDGSLLAASRNALIEAGMHRLLQFDLVKTRVYSKSNYSGSYSTKTIWLLNQNYLVFGNNTGRGDTGIPEPTTFGMLAAAGSMAVVCRRQRRQDA
jgi:hypothetical protein